jgi:glyoxylase-like metal-dependent hydrolase (beta-lactamase superfamily II)
MVQSSRSTEVLLGLLALLVGLDGCALGGAKPPPAPLTRNRQRESLEQAVRWKNPSPPVVLQLAGEYLSTGREREGYAYFAARAQEAPDEPLFAALAGMQQARMASQVPLLRRAAWVESAIGKLDRAASKGGLPRYLRGLVTAELPARFHRTEQAVGDLEWTLSLPPSTFPPGLQRGAWRGLARAYSALGRTADAQAATRKAGGAAVVDGPLFLTDGSVNAADGYRFTPPELLEMAPGVYVARGYDFADISFILTTDGVVAIDAGTTEASAGAALAAFRKVSDLPIRAIIITHAHWDHIGGLAALREPGTQVIAQAGFAEELANINRAPDNFQFFFGTKARGTYAFTPDVLVDHRQTLTFGNTQIVLVPAHGGETNDALLAFLPAQGVLFVGDTFMPYFGAPFVAEGSVDGLFETIDLIVGLSPSRLVHGHAPLTDNFTVATLAPLRKALVIVRDATLAGIHDGRTLSEVLAENLLPEELSSQPQAVLPFLLMRDNLIKRLFNQRTGYWKSDGEGLEVYTPAEWGAALTLLGGGREASFVEAARSLTARGDFGMSLELARLGLAAFPHSQPLAEARHKALEGLRLQDQFNPFKFIIYSDMEGQELPAPPQQVLPRIAGAVAQPLDVTKVE